ncbi:MAG: 4'-phosphopantetheinyl transferase superfamily protein [Wenzhouxiangellaceae bacterium]
MKAALGNDLIDFRASHNRGRAEQARLLARVLTADERAQLADERAGDVGFALLWSAKEAAYKAAKSIQPALVFAPGRWQVNRADLALGNCGNSASHSTVVIADHLPISVSWQHDAHWLHCIAVLGPVRQPIDSAVLPLADCTPAASFSEREHDSFSCEQSAAVRVLAKQLLTRRGVADSEIVRKRIGHRLLPPRVFSNGAARDDIQLSLSHDGDYVAATIAISG